MKLLNCFSAGLCLLILFSRPCSGQVFSENFNTGLPAAWTQSPSATWSLNPNLGISASGCAISADLLSTSSTSATTLTSIHTPTINLTGVGNPTLLFRVALIRNNFVNPNMAVYYNTSAGRQFLARWGSGFTIPTTYTTFGGTDHTPPLDPQNVYWDTCKVALPVAATNSVLSFAFDAEFVNEGYVLLDDVKIAGITNTLSINLVEGASNLVSAFPNPATGKITLQGKALSNVSITNNLGQNRPATYKVLNDSEIEISLDKLPADVYYLSALSEEKTVITKKIAIE